MAFNPQPHLFYPRFHHVKGFQRILESHLPESGRILDVGCGDHRNLAKYRTAQREIWGTDFQRHPKLTDIDWFHPLSPDGTIPFAADSFDVVTSIFVMEHVVDPRRFFKEVSRVMKPGGVFVGHTISGHHYIAWIRRLFGLLPHAFNQQLVRRLYGREHHDTFPAYYRLNTEPQLRWASRPTDLKLMHIERYKDYGYYRHSEFLQYWAARIEESVEKHAPGWGKIYFTATFQKDITKSEMARAA